MGYIVAFSGKKGVGKTTAADYLAGNYNFKKISFASALKEKAKLLFPFSYAHLYGDMKETKLGSYDWTPREFMVKFGQFMRYWDEQFWIKVVIDQIRKEPDTKWVIDDMRYRNEAALLDKEGAAMIRIERYKKHNPYKNGLFADDESETQLDNHNFKYRVEAFDNIDLSDLHKRLDIIMKTILYG